MAQSQFTAKTPNGCNATVKVEQSGNISINGSYTGYKKSSSGNIIHPNGSIAAKDVGVREFLVDAGLLKNYGQLKASIFILAFLFFT